MNTIYAITPSNKNLEELKIKVNDLLEIGINTFQYRSKSEDFS